jgi:hypothetical protein
MYQGIAYPGSAAKKQYRRVIKTLLVDSRDRSPLSTQSQYTVKLPKTYENIYAVTLKSAEVPYSWYTFSEARGNLSFVVTVLNYDGIGTDLTETITIPEGNYTATQFATALKDALDAKFGTNAFAVEYSQNTNTLMFTYVKDGSTKSFIFDFTAPQSQSAGCAGQSTVTPTSTYWGLGYYMGFDKKVYTSVNTSPSFLTSTFAVTVNPDNYILMELDFINKEDETSIDSRLSGRVDGCFAKLPITGNSGDVIFFRELCCPMNRSVMTPPLGQLRTLNIKWRFHDGRLVDFHNLDHSFTLEFELLENGFDEYSSMDFTPSHR